MKKFKKIICFIVTLSLVLTFSTSALAKSNNAGKKNNKKTESVSKEKSKKAKKNNSKKKVNKKYEAKSNEIKLSEKEKTESIITTDSNFKMNGSPVFKYEKFQLPLAPIVKGTGAKVSFNEETAVLTITKDDNTVEINFKDKEVKVNGILVVNPIIFAPKNNNGMTVLTKYICEELGIQNYDDDDDDDDEDDDVDDDDDNDTVPGLDSPRKVTVTPGGVNPIANTLNFSTFYLEASAEITPGQATDGRAELYVGNKLVAIDSYITAIDKFVTFTTSDGTPDNTELQAAVPTGGAVTVKLYNKENKVAVSKVNNPTLVVDYTVPTITGITSAYYNAVSNQLIVAVTGAGAPGDKVDVTKLTIIDPIIGVYTLTDNKTTGSKGTVNNSKTLVINLGSVDKLALTNIGSGEVKLSVAAGSLIYDAAGNKSPETTVGQIVDVAVIKP